MGLTTDWGDLSWNKVLGLAQAAEAAGWDTFMIPEAWGREAMVTLGSLAAHTTRIRLGTGIVNVYSRSPGVLAMAIATLDEISGGRAVLGLGTSGRRVIEGWHGMPFNQPLTRLRDYVAAIRGVLRKQRTGFTGKTIQMAPGFLLRMDVPRADVPIGLAAMSPVSIRMTGEIADQWYPLMTTPDQLTADMTHLQEGLAQSGRERSQITVAPFVLTVVDDDLEQAWAAARSHIAFYVGGMGDYYRQMVTRAGYAADADLIAAEWAAGHRKAAVAAVSNGLVDALAICGPTDRCRKRIAEWEAAGADMVIANLPTDASADQTAVTIRVLGTAGA